MEALNTTTTYTIRIGQNEQLPASDPSHKVLSDVTARLMASHPRELPAITYSYAQGTVMAQGTEAGWYGRKIDHIVLIPTEAFQLCKLFEEDRLLPHRIQVVADRTL